MKYWKKYKKLAFQSTRKYRNLGNSDLRKLRRPWRKKADISSLLDSQVSKVYFEAGPLMRNKVKACLMEVYLTSTLLLRWKVKDQIGLDYARTQIIAFGQKSNCVVLQKWSFSVPNSNSDSNLPPIIRLEGLKVHPLPFAQERIRFDCANFLNMCFGFQWT
jgi:hypothetical protein